MFEKKQQKLSILEEAIISVVVFFDLFDYPLTEFEIWKYCFVKCDLLDIRQILIKRANFLSREIDSLDGFYFLKGRSEIVKTRMKRYHTTDIKFKRALFVSKILRFIPWIKMIAVGNIIGSNNLREGGDIDLFIVTEDKRIWISRFFCVFVVKLLGMRPKINDVKDKICLSFFVSESGVDLQKLMLQSNDYYFIYWLAGLTPIYNIDNAYNNFVQKNNWIKEKLPNWVKADVVNRRSINRICSSFVRDVIDLFIGGLDQVLSSWQLKVMPHRLKSLINKDTSVMVSENVLKFHVNDRRNQINKEFRKQIVTKLTM